MCSVARRSGVSGCEGVRDERGDVWGGKGICGFRGWVVDLCRTYSRLIYIVDLLRLVMCDFRVHVTISC